MECLAHKTLNVMIEPVVKPDYVLVMLEAPLIKQVNPEYVVELLDGFAHFECHHSGGH